MQITGKHPHPTLLKRFTALKKLDPEQLELLSRSLPIQTALPNQHLIERGATNRNSFLLLSGELELVAEDGRRNRLRADDLAAREAVARLIPRRFDVYSRTPVAYLEIDAVLLNGLRKAGRHRQDDSIRVTEEDGDERTTWNHVDGGELANTLEIQIREDIEADRLVLPSLPQIALRIGQVLDDDATDAQRVATIIQTDPVMTAKIVRSANSALYGGMSPADTCVKAVTRLGLGATHKLVLSFALREVFAKGPARIQGALQGLWKHSVKVSALSSVLARLDGRFDPERALLSGLVHDIGEIPILTYAMGYPTLLDNPTALELVRRRLRGELGAAIIEAWNFPRECAVCPLEAEDWMRDSGPEPDYCDLIVTAQLHALVGAEHFREIPRIDEVPAFQKLDLGELTPELSIAVLAEAHVQVAATEAMLGA